MQVSSLEEALDKFVTPEILSESSQWMCPKCEKLVLCLVASATETHALPVLQVDARKGLKIKSFPPILMIHLKRFDYDPDTRTREKLNNFVKFPLQLNANKYVDENFELEAIRHPSEREKKEKKTDSFFFTPKDPDK